MKVATFVSLSLLAGTLQAATIHTKVAILGGGVSGISASLNLTLAGIDDFVLIEARDVLGGRAQDVKFGHNVTIEMGCNWVQALGTNPINLLSQKYNMSTVPTDYEDIDYIDEHGRHVNGSKEQQAFSDASDRMYEQALKRAKNNLVDISSRTALSLAGWIPRTPLEKAIEYFGYDWESGEDPERSSDVFGILNDEANYNGKFGHDLEGDRMNIDQRGFKYMFLQEAERVFKKKNDPRLKLGTTVKSIAYDKNGVTITTDKDTIIADYAISTFSVGVLQHRDVEWRPELPDWKMEGIFGFHLTTYTKIFMNFDRQFWSDHEFTLYAHPTSRGLFSVWQNMNAPGYFPQGTKDNVFMVTVTQDYAHMVEAMTDEQVKDQLMATLRKMYPDETIPEPTDFKFPRWHSDPLFRGSYSNWPIGEVDQHHVNMKAPLHNRVFFGGEAMSKDYYGYLQGGWMSGEEAAASVIQCIKKKKCPVATYYPEIVNAKMKGSNVLKKRAYIE